MNVFFVPLAVSLCVAAGCSREDTPATQPAGTPAVIITPAPTTPSAAEPIVIDAAPWMRTLVLRDGPIAVHLLVRPSASPADERFIGFELTNTGDAPIQIGNGTHYRISADIAPSEGPKRSSSLASGNDYDLLYRDVIPINGPRLPLAPGTSRRLDYSSGYSLALLGIPAAAKQTGVSARVHLTLQYPTAGNAYHLVATPPEGVPFEFVWTPIPDDKLAAVQERLRRLVRDADEGQRSGSALRALLSDDHLASAVALDDLLAGLSVRGQVLRDPLVKTLNARFADDPRARDAYLAALQRADRWWIWDLASADSRLRDPRFVEPLLTLIRSPQPRDFEMLLRAISPNIALAPDPAAVSSELGRLVLPKTRIIASGRMPGAKEASDCVQQINLLTLTQDKTLLPRLIPYLDCRETSFDPHMVAVRVSPVPHRVCDETYNAIVRLLNDPRGPLANMPPIAPDLAQPPLTAEQIQQVLADRDAQIAKLKSDVSKHLSLP